MSPDVTVTHLRCAAGGGGGADRVILNTVHRLHEGPFHQAVLYLVKPGTDLTGLVTPLRQTGLLCRTLPGRRLFDLRQFLAIRRFLRDHKVRVVHCHDAKADLYGFLLRVIQPSLKTISTLHGWTEKTRRGRIYSRLDKIVLRHFDATIAVSEHTARMAREQGIPRVFVVHNGIDTDEWPLASRPPRQSGQPFTVAFVGRISAEKGPMEFVETARIVLRQQPDSRFVVLGEGPDLPGMKQAVSAAGLGNHFDFRGHLPPVDLRRAYGEMDVLALPSRREGLPMAILEACATGVCIAAFAVGGVPEVIVHGRNGLLAQPGNTEDLAAQVLALQRDPLLLARLRDNARTTVADRFSLGAQVRQIEAVYAEVLKTGKMDRLDHLIPTS